MINVGDIMIHSRDILIHMGGYYDTYGGIL